MENRSRESAGIRNTLLSGIPFSHSSWTKCGQFSFSNSGSVSISHIAGLWTNTAVGCTNSSTSSWKGLGSVSLLVPMRASDGGTFVWMSLWDVSSMAAAGVSVSDSSVVSSLEETTAANTSMLFALASVDGLLHGSSSRITTFALVASDRNSLSTLPSPGTTPRLGWSLSCLSRWEFSFYIARTEMVSYRNWKTVSSVVQYHTTWNIILTFCTSEDSTLSSNTMSRMMCDVGPAVDQTNKIHTSTNGLRKFFSAVQS